MVAFVMTRLTGDPLDVLLDARATEDDRKAMASVLGLDRPLPVQYAIYLGHAVLGNFGDSFKTRRPALTMVMERLPLTLELGTTAFLVSLVIAVPIGVVTARAKGLRESGVVWKHALRNALIPPLTYAGLIFVGLLAGAVVTETVYAWPGVGQLVIESVAFRDFPVIQVILLLFGVMYVGMNLVIDLLYIWIDPRIGLAETTVRRG